MGMQISQHKGVAGKLMNSFVRHIRIVSNVSGGIGKPVAVHFHPFYFLYPGQNHRIDDIVHISCNGYCSPGCQPGKYRSSRLSLLFSRLSLHPVSRHLVYQGKGHGKRKPRHKGTHQIIGKFNLCTGKLCQKYGKILAAVIIIDMSL